ncbi:MAG: hypothetical protein J6P80_03935 [Kiritimatiellae bacterium]|nr:hypothetical protein [Kiritimatiellia bacterium]
MAEWRELASVTAVMALVLAAAALATPKGRVPLALRGIKKILKRDSGDPDGAKAEPAPLLRRLTALALVVLAFWLALA